MNDRSVRAWAQDVQIPTYGVGEPETHPMFLEKRVYQGSSGRVYPHTVIERITGEKAMKTYRAVFLENRYLHVMILPELGGRIHRALDKTNGYDFVYYNRVIKPALVGLNGPWISGGIEFNWPQHHRPSTFDPVDHAIRRNADGSCTVWVGEIEIMSRTKGMAGITLYPDKAYIEIAVRLYNRTPLPQTFLWWANPALPVNEDTQSIFPPDVTAVMDHGKRAVSTFPIATGTYYKVDYSAGVDISRYKNIPSPTSYMAHRSDYDFVGGYDFGREAGLLHVADHHIAPGKKQWTWGCGDFGRAWDRNLTDEDGPYVELMTGCFTDNQPDFSWLAPMEEKRFTQYFMPYKGVGTVRNATVDAAIGFEREADDLVVRVYATAAHTNARVLVRCGDDAVLDTRADLCPERCRQWRCAQVGKGRVEVQVYDEACRMLADAREYVPNDEPVPEPAKPVPPPEAAATCEDLYLYGLHLEQYRHATFRPEDYYREGLRRDPADLRLNNAYGRLLLRRGRFAESEPFFRQAIAKATGRNPNPYDGEPYYNLGLSLLYQGRAEEAYDAFYKATWNGAWQAPGFFRLACIDAARGHCSRALEHLERVLGLQACNLRARNLKTALLRRMNRGDDALALARETAALDPLDPISRFEWSLMDEENAFVPPDEDCCIELAWEYADAGLHREAALLMERLERARGLASMACYHMAYFRQREGDEKMASSYRAKGAAADRKGCFPYRWEDAIVLEDALRRQPADARALLHMGNLWYDKTLYPDAIHCWEQAAALRPECASVHRNLALAYFNKLKRPEDALREMETAFRTDSSSARILMELDQLRKRLAVPLSRRLQELDKQRPLVALRDDLYLERIALLNLLGRSREALELIQTRRFHPWEGGEGKVPAQYVRACLSLAREALKARPAEALELLRAATTYPPNLGEGKLYGAQENDIHYYMGLACRELGREAEARTWFEQASQGLSEPTGMLYYYDQPPETIYYQGLALRELGRWEEAERRFQRLFDYGAEHLDDVIKPDYFAVSLPDLLIFEADLDQRNRIHCLFMSGLGALGLGRLDECERRFAEILSMDPSHPCQVI